MSGTTGAHTLDRAVRPAVRLTLTQIGPDFDPKNDVALGPWCFDGAEALCPGWENLPFADPFPTSDALEAADAATRGLANVKAFELAERLNRYHGRNYSATYWRTLLMHWLIAVIQTTWRRYRHIEFTAERLRDRAVVVEVLAEPPTWRIANLNTFMDRLLGDALFDFWLTSELVRAISPPGWSLVPGVGPSGAATDSSPEAGLEQYGRLSTLVRRVMGHMSLDSVQGIRLTKVAFSLYINALPLRPACSTGTEVNASIQEMFPAPYLSALQRVLDACMPKSLLDGYPALEARARSLRFTPGRLLVDHVASMDDRHRVELAQAQEAGERLVGYQHGGMYGSARTMPWTSETEYNQFAFLSWGWTRQGRIARGRVVPLPSPYLSRYRGRHRERNARLVLVGAKMFIRGNRMDSVPSPARCVTYRRWKCRFIDALGANTRRALAYRPFLKPGSGLADAQYLTKRYPNLPIIDGDLMPELLGCRLVVLDHVGTTLNLAMAANVPIVCYWERDAWPLCAEAEPYFEVLRRAGLLFDSPEEAAGQVDRVWSDVGGWWRSETVQSARGEWCDRYARSARLWWVSWIKAFWTLSRESGGDGSTAILEPTPADKASMAQS